MLDNTSYNDNLKIHKANLPGIGNRGSNNSFKDIYFTGMVLSYTKPVPIISSFSISI